MTSYEEKQFRNAVAKELAQRIIVKEKDVEAWQRRQDQITQLQQEAKQLVLQAITEIDKI